MKKASGTKIVRPVGITQSLFVRDVDEWKLLDESREVFARLLVDHSVTAYNREHGIAHNGSANIKWCTEDYASDFGYHFEDELTPEQIAREDKRIVICPRADKSAEEQRRRSVQKAEVFTPSWVCNAQNNLIDAAWFGLHKKWFPNGPFNKEIPGKPPTWEPIVWTGAKHSFLDKPKAGKTWQEYVDAPRLEVSCGEAPYLTSRYDSTSTEKDCIPVPRRIGFLDRKLRIVGEVCGSNRVKWRTYALRALKSCYGFEWQGDNVFLARENMLYAMLEAYYDRFHDYLPMDECVRYAEVISWNIWQMDGIKFVAPNTCHDVEMPRKKKPSVYPSFPEFEDQKGEAVVEPEQPVMTKCPGCKKGDPKLHNGIRCRVMDWTLNEPFEFKPPFEHFKEDK